VAFSGAAAVHCPLTTDHGYLLSVLDVLDTGVISLEGTDIAAALRQAREVFADKKRSDPASQAVVLFSDGEVVAGDAEDEARALRSTAQLFVVGVGSPEGSVVPPPEWLRGYERVFASAQERHSRLDETALKRVAKAGGGVYLRSQPDGWDIEQIHEHLMRMAARSGGPEGLRERPINRYGWPLGIAFACMTAEALWLTASPWVQRRRMRRGNPPEPTPAGKTR
jgi:Ca-activated chloride channel family protein